MAKRTPSRISKPLSRKSKAGTRPRDHRSVPATEAKNRFGEILRAARDSGAVFIERHGQAQAVVLGIAPSSSMFDTSSARTWLATT